MRRNILLVDDNKYERERLAALLRKELASVVLEADDPQDALLTLDELEISLVITNIFLPQKGGLDLLREVQKRKISTSTVVAIPHENREVAAEVLKFGALQFLNTPYQLDEAVIVAARALQHHELLVHKEQRGPKLRKSDGYNGIIGPSARMQDLFSVLQKVAEDRSSTVLVQGESGTGKELVARAIHQNSSRRGKNFVPVNCAAIPEDLLESELFGYLKGAFTGAAQSKMGRIQYAEGGTLFLDEIGDMKHSLQAKLLRVLQEREFEPVGGVKPVSVDVRVIAATHQNLETMVAEGKFREDLYYRLSVVPIVIPPLRDRRDDIQVLVEKFVTAFNRDSSRPLVGFSECAMAALMDYPWPGNVRELENLVQRMVILNGGRTVSSGDLPEIYRAHLKPGTQAKSPEPSIPIPVAPCFKPVDFSQGGVDFSQRVNDFEVFLINNALNAANGNKKEAARLLNLKRTTLLEKIKRKQL